LDTHKTHTEVYDGPHTKFWFFQGGLLGHIKGWSTHVLGFQ
jgi:hypothetical protein